MPGDEDAPYLPVHPGIEVRVVGRNGRAHGELLVEGVRRAAEELCPVGVPQEVEEIDVDRELLWDVPRHAKGGDALKRTTLYAWLAGERRRADDAPSPGQRARHRPALRGLHGLLAPGPRRGLSPRAPTPSMTRI